MSTQPKALPLPTLFLACNVLMCFAFAFAKRIDPQAATWIEILLMVSVLILMPLARRLSSKKVDPSIENYEFISGMLLIHSLLTPVPTYSGILSACPWLMMRVVEAGKAINDWRTKPVIDPAILCEISARIFPAIGAVWLIANRANWMPFGFDALIVLLTAAHFHHAGFTLPLMAGLCGKHLPGKFSRASCWLILAGVPLVAIGITCTHFKTLSWLEPISVTVLVLGALGLALLQMRMAFQRNLGRWSRALFFVSGLSLLIAMLLALSFGLRSVLPAWALSMPSMWAIHGSLNTFGFGLGGILAWRAMQRQLAAE